MSEHDVESSASIGNPRDVQGVIAIGVVAGAFTVGGIAILRGTDPNVVLNNILPLASMVVGFYFGRKSAE